ncbi:MAG: hypothetical protein IKP22_14925 [Clostridia bacterium]|nr:hypothetical protein [Clostridia bacterium]
MLYSRSNAAVTVTSAAGITKVNSFSPDCTVGITASPAVTARLFSR